MKYANLVSIGRGRGHVTYFFKFWDSLYISAMAKAKDFKFCKHIKGQGS